MRTSSIAASVALLGVSCQGAPGNAGLLVIFAPAPDLAADTLSVGVQSMDDGGTTRFDQSLPQTAPITLGIVTEGRAEVSVTITASVSKNKTVLDARAVVVADVPVDRVAELVVAFDGACTPAAAGLSPVADGCVALGACSERCEASSLPTFGGDAGVALELDAAAISRDDAEAPLDATVGATDATSGSMDATVSTDAPVAEDATATDAMTVPDGLEWPFPPSCSALDAAPAGTGLDCSDTVSSDCCANVRVIGGTYDRSYDGVTFTDSSHPAQVSTFRLDEYEVTVGRFREFVSTVLATGWVPPANSGKHTYLADGGGLANVAEGGAPFETGWDPSWDANLATTLDGWNTNLGSCQVYSTWSSTPGANDAAERDPLNCVTFYEAYAFCIWDGGFLPSESEWNYAAAGGSAQRPYPWGSEAPGAGIGRAIYGCYFPDSPGAATCVGTGNIAPVGSVQGGAGNGLWGHADLAGNVAEWVLDDFAPYAAGCNDCVALGAGDTKVNRGGAFDSPSSGLYAAARVALAPYFRSSTVGLRCARAP